MATKKASIRWSMIDKANNLIVIVSGLASFIVIFSLVASKTLINQMSYQDRVAAAKQTALNQLKTDVTNSTDLTNSYKAFIRQPHNIIGGSPSGSGPQDGDNAQIVLDALPSQYDFPALTTSLASLLNSQGVQISGISGTDEQLTQQNEQTSSTPQAVPMPFEFTINSSYQNVVNALNAFEASIRPFDFQTVTLSGGQGNLTLDATAQTYYQPGKTFDITEEVVK